MFGQQSLRVVKIIIGNSALRNFAAFFSNAYPTASKVAVVLSGSGVYDGSEIHEASAMLVHLTRAGAQPLCYAPDVDQMHVVDHLKGSPAEGQTRNVLVESARIARGAVQPLSALSAAAADAVLFPGGFGAAKNLSDFAVSGAQFTVHPEVRRVLTEFHASKKPIGLACIAPVLAAKVIPGCTLTLGASGPEAGDKWPHAGAVDNVRPLGVNLELKRVNEVCVDANNRLVTTPAFMYDGQFHEIFDGIGLLVTELLKLVRK
ncbi:ES1 protein homolog, mitochondrial-like [Bacillus rossius redtenbacheri]|uniref:ES1 protein homolog, mitochondrial-like n=1 Tax=Bacillus rossius redtenbacheri TaxID=93214 RepID=UPI002FDDB3E2